MILDLVGQRFGNLIVTEEHDSIISNAGNKSRIFQCLCDCGKRSLVRMGNLRSGHTTSCGCKRVKNSPRTVDRTGQVFGSLIINGVARTRGTSTTWWQCSCLCGKTVQLRLVDIRQQQDCGCGLSRKEYHGEEWKDIPWLPGRYMVSNHGRVKSILGKRELILTPFENRKGYLCLTLRAANGKPLRTSIHRIVARVFIDNPNGKPAVNHIDCDKKNNHSSNLEWVTPAENTCHAKKHNLLGKNKPSKGSMNGMSKLTEEKVKDIRKLNGLKSVKEIADIFGVDKTTIHLVLSRKTWRHV